MKVVVFLEIAEVVENNDCEDVSTAVDNVVDVTWDVSVRLESCVVLLKVVVVIMRTCMRNPMDSHSTILSLYNSSWWDHNYDHEQL